jgi:hypothetical protein
MASMVNQMGTMLTGGVVQAKALAESAGIKSDEAVRIATEAKAVAEKSVADTNSYGRLQDLYQAAVESWVTDGVRLGRWVDREAGFSACYTKGRRKWCSKKYMTADQLREAITWAQDEHAELMASSPAAQTAIDFRAV